MSKETKRVAEFSWRARRRGLALALALGLQGCAYDPFGWWPEGQAGAPVMPQTDRLDLARAAYARGNYGIAIAHLERELAEMPSSISAYNGLGASFDQMGRYDVAQRYYFKALELDPDSAMTLGNLGYSYLKEGRAAEAAELLAQAVERAPANATAAQHLQLALARLGEEGGMESRVRPGVPPDASRPAIQALSALPAAIPFPAALRFPIAQPLPLPSVQPLPVQSIAQPSRAGAALALAAADPAPVLSTESAPARPAWRLIVTNGNGVTGMAARVGQYLTGKGARVRSLRNAQTFTHEQSVLYYGPGGRAAAEGLAALLPVSGLRLEERAADQGAGAELLLLLGRDAAVFDAGLRGRTLPAHHEA